MKEYRLYEFKFGGTVIHRVDLFSSTEEEAIERAKRRVMNDPIELWEGERRVAQFHPKISN
jgi:hypothetical protein